MASSLADWRRVAFEICSSWKPSFAIRDHCRNHSAFMRVSAERRAQIMSLVLSYVAARGQSQELVENYLKKSLPPKVMLALQLACTELLFHKTDPAVVVSQGVELVAQEASWARKLANAVLRNILRNDFDAIQAARERFGDASIKAKPSQAEFQLAAALPSWLAEKLYQRLPLSSLYALSQSSVIHRDAWLCWIDGGVKEGEGALARLGIQIKARRAQDFLICPDIRKLYESGLVQEGRVVVADQASCRIAQVLSKLQAKTMLEIGCGRGGKTSMLAHLDPQRHILALDLSARRLSAAKVRCAQFSQIDFIEADASEADSLSEAVRAAVGDGGEGLPPSFDVVYIDAPCSGSGTTLRHPEIVWNLREDAVSSLSQLQSKILKNASSFVREASFLIYTSCSVFKEENEELIYDFLASAEGLAFELCDPCEEACLCLEGFDRISEVPGLFQSFPNQDQDGHFLACMRPKIN